MLREEMTGVVESTLTRARSPVLREGDHLTGVHSKV
jgi:hypothetical protein